MSLRMLTACLATVLVVPSAHAQEAASSKARPSVESYLCTFAGKCDGVAGAQPVATRDAPQTKGFRLAKPTAEANGTAAVAAPSRGIERATRRPTPRRAHYAAPSAPAVNYGATQRPRADLMIGFELNSAQLSAEGTRAAQVFARSLLMPELKDKRFLIEGHTDLRGGARINGPLSAARAKAVADYLVVLGVDRRRLETRGFGSAVPLPGHGKGDPANRRVEAELIS